MLLCFTKIKSIYRRAKSAYILYFTEKLNFFKEKNPHLKMTELSPLISKEWKLLGEEEKQVIVAFFVHQVFDIPISGIY